MTGVIGESIQNLMGLFNCALEYATCGFVQKSDSGFFFAFVLVLAATLGLAFLLAGSFQYLLGPDGAGLWKANGLPLGVKGFSKKLSLQKQQIWTRRLKKTYAVVLTLLAFVICFVFVYYYSVGYNYGKFSYISWMIVVPLWSLLLLLGVVAIVAYPAFVIHTLRDSSTLKPTKWWKDLFFYAIIAGIIYLWGLAWQTWPFIAEGPFGKGPLWLQDALALWPLAAPVHAGWAFFSFLATPNALLIFIVLALLSVLLGMLSKVQALNVAAMAVSQVSFLILATIITVLVGLLLFALAVTVLVVLMAYAVFYVLAAVLTVGILSAIFSR